MIYKDDLEDIQMAKLTFDNLERRFPKDKRLEVKLRDAKLWLEQAPDGFTDFILSDLYHASEVNEVQLEKEFIENCYRVLRPNGWLTLNYHKMPTAESLTINQLCHFFPSVFMLNVNTDNWVVVASKQEVSLQAVMSVKPNMTLPAPLLSSLKLLQGRLLKVNRNRKTKS